MKQSSFLVCPTDKTPLICNNSVGHCPQCGIDYYFKDGVWKLQQSNNLNSTDVVQWFNQRAESIDDEQILRGAPDKWHARFFKKDLENIKNFLNLNKADYLLDIGCGNGLFIEQYAKLVKKAVGTDISIKMLKRSSRRLHNENILLIQADSLKLPFADNTFDAILCNWVIHYFKMPELTLFFQELKRVARKNCRIFLGEIPLRHSLRNYEAAIGHFLAKRAGIKISDRYLSPVDTTKFSAFSIENLALKEGFSTVAKGTMRHVLPSLHIPYIGQVVPNRIQHLFERYDYKKSIPLISHSYFIVLTK